MQLRYLQPSANPPTRWLTLALRLPGPIQPPNYFPVFQVPKASLLDPLFAPVDLANPTSDNLGLIKTKFYLQTWGQDNAPNFYCMNPK